jgi:hypothetical protein
MLSACVFVMTARSENVEEYPVKAGLSLNFARFTKWPNGQSDADASNIKMCVIGNNIVQEAFTLVDNKPVGDKTLTVVNSSRLHDLERCQLLFVTGLEKNKTIQLLAEVHKLPILTIGDEIDFLKSGGLVCLQLIDGKMEIKVNHSASVQKGLDISSRLLQHATIENQ